MTNREIVSSGGTNLSEAEFAALSENAKIKIFDGMVGSEMSTYISSILKQPYVNVKEVEEIKFRETSTETLNTGDFVPSIPIIPSINASKILKIGLIDRLLDAGLLSVNFIIMFDSFRLTGKSGLELVNPSNTIVQKLIYSSSFSLSLLAGISISWSLSSGSIGLPFLPFLGDISARVLIDAAKENYLLAKMRVGISQDDTSSSDIEF